MKRNVKDWKYNANLDIMPRDTREAFHQVWNIETIHQDELRQARAKAKRISDILEKVKLRGNEARSNKCTAALRNSEKKVEEILSNWEFYQQITTNMTEQIRLREEKKQAMRHQDREKIIQCEERFRSLWKSSEEANAKRGIMTSIGRVKYSISSEL